MATVETINFTDYTTGNSPSGFTRYDAAQTWVVEEVGPSGVYTKSVVAGGAAGVYNLSCLHRPATDPADVDNTEQLFVVKAENSGSGSNAVHGGVGTQFKDQASDKGYGASFNCYKGYPGSANIAINELQYDYLDTLASDKPAEDYAYGTWYVIRFRVYGNTLKAKCWEWGTPEPVAWDVETTHSSSSDNDDPGILLFHVSSGVTEKFYVAYVSIAYGTEAEPVMPEGAVPEPITGDGDTAFEDFAISGMGGAADLIFEFELEGFGNFSGDVSFEDGFSIIAEALGASGIGAVTYADIADDCIILGYGNYYGAIDFPEFILGSSFSGFGEVEFESSDFDIAARGGAVGNLTFSFTVDGDGSIINTGEVGINFENIEVGGTGNFYCAISFSDFTVDAEGVVNNLGNGIVECNVFSISGIGFSGLIASGDIYFPQFTVNVTGSSPEHADVAVDFPLFTILGSGLRDLRGNGTVSFDKFSILSQSYGGSSDGDGAVVFDLDITGSGSNDQCYHKLLEFVR